MLLTGENAGSIVVNLKQTDQKLTLGNFVNLG